MKTLYTFQKILLPVDESEFSKRAIVFAGNFLQYFNSELSEITLFHVIRTGCLTKHETRMDLRAEILKSSELFKKLKEQFLKDKIKPILDEYENILKNSGIKAEITQRIEEGNPGNEIIKLLSEEEYTSVFISRRGMSLSESLLIGSVSTKVVYNTKKQVVYLIGEKFSKKQKDPVSKILILVDGSEYSKKALEHGVYVVKRLKEKIKEIKLLRVINLDVYYKRISQGITPEKEAEEDLLLAKKKFLDEYIPEKLLQMQILIGIPSKEIVKYIKENNYDLVVMGRRGRSPLKDLVMGGVSSAVVYHCKEPAIAIINL